MSRRIFIVAILLGLMTGACAEKVDPALVTAESIAFGRYDVGSGATVLVEATAEIPCEPGAVFGVDYRVNVGEGRRGVIPVEFHWQHPELSVPSKKLWGTEPAARLPNPELPKHSTL